MSINMTVVKSVTMYIGVGIDEVGLCQEFVHKDVREGRAKYLKGDQSIWYCVRLILWSSIRILGWFFGCIGRKLRAVINGMFTRYVNYSILGISS